MFTSSSHFFSLGNEVIEPPAVRSQTSAMATPVGWRRGAVDALALKYLPPLERPLGTTIAPGLADSTAEAMLEVAEIHSLAVHTAPVEG